MNLQQLSPEFSVTSQIAPSDMAAIKEEGFKAIICNRPDGEDAGQPAFAEIAAAAKAAGLDARHVPIKPGQATPEAVAAFGTALAELPGPVLGYCRSGNRSAALWSRLNPREPAWKGWLGQLQSIATPAK